MLVNVLSMKIPLTVCLTNIYRLCCFKMILIRDWKYFATFKLILPPKWQNMSFSANDNITPIILQEKLYFRRYLFYAFTILKYRIKKSKEFI